VSVPVWAYELLAAPVVFVLALLHARRALGAGRAAVEILALVLYGYALERVAIAVFASHVYGSSWRLAPGGVPLAVAATWAAVITSAMALAARLAGPSAVERAAVAALLGVSLDLLMEPVAAARGLWSWTPPGPWLDVPVGNFVGWFVIVGAYTLGAERFEQGVSIVAQAMRRVVLGLLSVAALVLVGLLWRALDAEHAFAGWVGWLAVLAFWLATWARARRPAGTMFGAGLASRLGRAEGAAPAIVLLLLAALFATDAATLRDWRLALVAVVALAVLGAAARASVPSVAFRTRSRPRTREEIPCD
jgi:Carotenoid biosynthesis protein